MNTETGIGSSEDIERLRVALQDISNVAGVESQVRDGAKGQFVRYVIYLDDEAKGDDIRISEIKNTQIPLLMRSKEEDWWFDTDVEKNPIIFNTAGLNSDPERHPGAHNL